MRDEEQKIYSNEFIKARQSDDNKGENKKTKSKKKQWLRQYMWTAMK